MSSIRATVDPTTGEVSVTDQLMLSVKSQAPEPTPAPRQTQAIRIQHDQTDDSMHVSVGRPTGGHFVPQVNQGGGVTVRSEGGVPSNLSQATKNSIINIPNLGETSIAAAITMGYVRPAATGGFEMIGTPEAPQLQQQQQQPTEEQAQQNDVPAATAEDLRGVAPTSVESDATLRTLQTQAPEQLNYLIEAAARGTEVDYRQVAQLLGDPDAGEKIAAMHQDHLRAGQQLLSGIGVNDHAAYEAWVRRTDPEMASTITRDVLNKDMRSLATSGRRYLKARDAAMENAFLGKNIPCTRDKNGALYVSREAVGLSRLSPRRGDFGNSPWISVAEAEKQQLISFNE